MAVTYERRRGNAATRVRRVQRVRPLSPIKL